MYVVTLPSALIVLQDAAVDIYHRTAVDKILPYTEQFDNISWWMSAGVVNSHAWCVLMSTGKAGLQPLLKFFSTLTVLYVTKSVYVLWPGG